MSNEANQWDTSMYEAMCLGKLIEALKGLPQDAVTKYGFNDAYTYRGYYEELAVQPATASIGAMVKVLEGALDTVMEGYKGGQYTMHQNVGVWLAEWGATAGSEPITSSWLRLVELDAAARVST